MNKEKFKGITNIVIGCLSICLAIACYAADTGDTEREMAYGGDAYTGIQNAGAVTANNAKCIAQIASFGFGSILLVTGCLVIGGGIGCLITVQDSEKPKKGVKIVQEINAPPSVSASPVPSAPSASKSEGTATTVEPASFQNTNSEGSVASSPEWNVNQITQQ